ncbi:DUF4249 domain-containing protein [Sphingobacterium sp. BIGb0165]|uniref:DUF4249 domain-containing protein n=1 Tax=Sphingobacterium sp. BIGb0165 TaxID=2940615 RepID=UPI00216A5B41|nr:DUF4249 domain-containing protein [Sphingobacterium sp. BIGb0165]MCS4227980.1 hypothetical protein [Sphingobacterium sp. BIGb0165]
MNVRQSSILSCLLLLISSCEEKMDLDLHKAAARVVIDAQLSDASLVQRIRVSRSVGFTDLVNTSGIKDATVSVKDNENRIYSFQYEKDGYYIHRSFKPVAGRSYALNVTVQKQQYSSSCQMPSYVAVDSTGISEKSLTGKTYFFATLTFKDPAKISNYYIYTLSINSGPFRFADAQSDQFNDGLKVTHYISDLETDLSPSDEVIVRRYCVDEKAYRYWSEYQNNNVSNAAPGNPRSNISNNALGYFSVASLKEYKLKIGR